MSEVELSNLRHGIEALLLAAGAPVVGGGPRVKVLVTATDANGWSSSASSVGWLTPPRS